MLQRSILLRILVSRVGIEPTTRRLRVQGWMSAYVQRFGFLRKIGSLTSARVRCFC